VCSDDAREKRAGAALFRAFTNGAKTVEARGSSVRQVLLSLALAHPGIGGHVFAEDGDQPRYLNLYVNGQEVREGAGFDTPSAPSDQVVLLPAMSTPPTPAPIPPAVSLKLDPAALREIEVHVQAIADELIRWLSRRPELLYQLRPRQLEELMAELYEREGFEVELTPETHDGGVDLFLVKHTPFGRLLTLVDTKRHAPDRPVGVGVVRQLFGVVEAKRASAGVVTTTSFFSASARRFQEEVPFRLGLQDFLDVHKMLQDAESRQQRVTDS
jgi:molybdopterin converting factor small subunit